MGGTWRKVQQEGYSILCIKLQTYRNKRFGGCDDIGLGNESLKFVEKVKGILKCKSYLLFSNI